MNRNTKYARSKKGVATKLLGHQNQSSKKRGHPLPSYTKDEFKEWLFSDPDFDSIHKNWVDSGYEKNLAPSVDRIDDYLPYTLSNIRLCTWRENNKKHHEDRLNGVNNKASKSVAQMDLDGNVISTFVSIHEAARRTDSLIPNIGHCCNGRRKTHHGFTWKYI